MSLKGLILQATVLLCLTAITSQIMICDDNRNDCHCDYSKFLEVRWPSEKNLVFSIFAMIQIIFFLICIVVLEVIKSDKNQQRIMEGMEVKCQNEIDSYKIGNPILVEITDLALAEVPLSKEEHLIFTDLSNLHDITECVDMILIIPGYKTNVKAKTPKILVKLVYYLREKETDKSIYVLDVGEHFMENYEDSVFKMSDIGRHLGESLAKIPNLKTLHIIGIDLGAHIAAYASRICNRINILKINRISALNPVSICIECRGAISKDLADFVDVYRTTDFYGYDEKNKDLASVIFQIRDEKTKNSYKTFFGSTEQAIDVFIDPILGEKRIYTIKQSKDKTFCWCDKDMSETEFGYAINTVPPTDGNYVTVLAKPKEDCVCEEPKKEVEESKEEVDESEEQFGDPKSQVEILSKEVEEPKEEVDESEEQFGDPKSQVEILSKEVEEPKEEVDESEEHFGDPKSQVEILSKEVEEPKEEVDESEEQFGDPKSQVEILSKEVEEPKEEVDKSEEQFGDPKSQVEILSKEVEEPKEEVDKSEEQFGDPKSQVEILSKEVEEPKEEVDKSEEQFGDPKSQVEILYNF